VTTLDGSRLIGDVVAAEAGGALRLAGPQFGQEVQVLVPRLGRVALPAGDKRSGSAEVVLSNGDRIVGELDTIKLDAVAIQTAAAGRLIIDRKVIRAVVLAKPAGVLAEGNLALGDLGPWASDGGKWIVSDEALLCRNTDMGHPLYVALDRKEAVTLVAKIQAEGGASVHCDMGLFADNAKAGPDHFYGKSSLTMSFQGSMCSLRCVSDGGSSAWSSGGRSFRQGTFRLAYDPAAGRAQVWVNSEAIVDHNVTKVPAGRFAIFNSASPLRIERLAVLRGVVPPGGGEEGAALPAEPGKDTIVEFLNQDRVSAAAVTLAGGQLAIGSAHGDLRCPLASVGRILFGAKGREEPRRQPGDVRVTASLGRLTFCFERLTADELVGRSEYLGEVRLRRSAVRQIQFNPYADGPLKGQPASKPGSVAVPDDADISVP
jgi:hypothetical protein